MRAELLESSGILFLLLAMWFQSDMLLLNSFAEIKVGPELSKSGMISIETICNIVALVGSVSKRDLCYLCSFPDYEVVRTCGFVWLPLCKMFPLLKLVPWTPFCDACCQQQIKLGSFFLASYCYLLLFVYYPFMLT